MDPADSLRNHITVGLPDPRMENTDLKVRYEVISQFELVPDASENVRIHFETAKNLYLYAWHVYRFYMVAEHYVFSTLEMAIRERLLQVGLLSGAIKKLSGLSDLLKAAQGKGLISNDRFVGRDRWIMRVAHERFDQGEILRMIDEGNNEMEVDHSNVQPTKEEMEYDWLEHFIRHLPKQRNMHAHGTWSLYPASVLWTFEIVTEIINQLYAPENSTLDEMP